MTKTLLRPDFVSRQRQPATGRRPGNSLNRVVLLVFLTLGLGWHARHANAQASASATAGQGTIQGRVLNENTGSYIGNAQVSIAGTSLSTSTDASGFYRLTNIPAGQVEVTVNHVGLEPGSATVKVSSSNISVHDFGLRLHSDSGRPGREVIQLDAFSVTDRQLSGRASALQEQKNAPNIKNVISFDEFGEMGEGNVAEYLKFVPGLDITYSPNVPLYMSIRGMPASGTLVLIDGVGAATTNPIVSRNFDFSLTATANIDRIEVTKTPTPDLPANAVGGSINIITKTGFSQAKPTLKYNVYLTHDEKGGISDFSPSFGTSPGPDSITTRRDMSPSFNLSYIRPINDKLAFTLTASHAARKMDWNYFTPTWDRVRLVQTGNAVNNVSVWRKVQGASGSLDWRIAPNDVLTFSVQRNLQTSDVRSNSYAVALGAGATGGPNFSQGASIGVGTLTRAYTNNTQEKVTDVFGLRYKHNGTVWKLDGVINLAKGMFDSTPKGGYFTSVTTTNSLNGDLILRMEGLTAIEDLKNPVYSATNRAGAPVDIYRGDTLSMTAAGLVHNMRDHDVFTTGFNAERRLETRIPITLKAGVLVDRQERFMANDNQNLAFNPPSGAAGRLLSNYDAFAPGFSNLVLTVDANGNPQKPLHLDTEKIFKKIYTPNPTWFAVNEAARHTNWVTNRRDLEETISAGYIRGDVRLMENRLWLIGGVRYERTATKGAGPKDDISAIYVKNPDGTLARSSTGALIPITTNALAQAQLRYSELGTSTEQRYDGFYPSINASYDINRYLVARAAYARTIGRPELSELIPGATVADPGAADGSRAISANNPSLEPWTADNFDVTLEMYNVKDIYASVSLFRKDVKGFYATTTTTATRALVESYGLEWEDIYSLYDIVSKRNAGSASVNGIELSYRHSLKFLPGWGKRFQIFANYTHIDATGPDASNFSYSPQRINWGIGYYGRKFNANLNVADGKPVRTGSVAANATTPANSYNYELEYPRYDLSAEYNFSRRLGVYASVRNLFGEPKRSTTSSDSTVDYARPRTYQYAGALFSMGIKGEW